MSELLTAARPYAKALFKSAKEKNMLDEYFGMLKNLNMVLDNKDIKNILLNDSFDYKYKTSFINFMLMKSFFKLKDPILPNILLQTQHLLRAQHLQQLNPCLYNLYLG